MIAMDTGDEVAARPRTYCCACASTSARGSAALTRPIDAASVPETFREEKSRSSAAAVPTRGGSSQLMPHSAIRPRCANAVMMIASSAMKRRSQANTIGTAMPAAGPLIAAITGLGTDIRYVWVPRCRSSPNVGSPGSARRSAEMLSPAKLPSLTAVSLFMSAPAQNPRPAPVITMPTTRGSRSAWLTAWRTSKPILSVQALSTSGRFSVIVATGSSTSYRICSYSVTEASCPRITVPDIPAHHSVPRQVPPLRAWLCPACGGVAGPWLGVAVRAGWGRWLGVWLCPACGGGGGGGGGGGCRARGGGGGGGGGRGGRRGGRGVAAGGCRPGGLG